MSSTGEVDHLDRRRLHVTPALQSGSWRVDFEESRGKRAQPASGWRAALPLDAAQCTPSASASDPFQFSPSRGCVGRGLVAAGVVRRPAEGDVQVVERLPPVSSVLDGGDREEGHADFEMLPDA
eukprot:3706244-Pyramimonas_sp.AAC.1